MAYFWAAPDAADLAGVSTAQVAAAVFLLRRGRFGQRQWTYAGLSAGCSALIFLFLLVYELRAEVPPTPSLADAAFFGAVVFMVPAILAFPQR